MVIAIKLVILNKYPLLFFKFFISPYLFFLSWASPIFALFKLVKNLKT